MRVGVLLITYPRVLAKRLCLRHGLGSARLAECAVCAFADLCGGARAWTLLDVMSGAVADALSNQRGYLPLRWWEGRRLRPGGRGPADHHHHHIYLYNVFIF